MQCYRRSMKVPYTEHVTNEKNIRKSTNGTRIKTYSPVSSLTNWNTSDTPHATTHLPRISCWAQCLKRGAREARKSNG